VKIWTEVAALKWGIENWNAEKLYKKKDKIYKTLDVMGNMENSAIGWMVELYWICRGIAVD
jgi:hypothetical protein